MVSLSAFVSYRRFDEDMHICSAAAISDLYSVTVDTCIDLIEDYRNMYV